METRERNALGAGPGWVVPMGLAIIAGLTLADALWVGETLASTLTFNGDRPDNAHVEQTTIDGRDLGIALRRAG